MRFLDVPYFKQDTNYTCGPTALQMVLAYYGIHESEAKLKKLLHTQVESGTAVHDMIKAVQKHGLYAYVNNESSFDELEYLYERFKLPSLIRYIETDENEDHYAVVIGVSDEFITLHDPWHGPRFQLPREGFAKRWLCDKYGVCSKWLLAVSPTPLPFGRQYNPN